MHVPFEQTGNSSGKDIIFVHGNGFTPQCYKPLIDNLTNTYLVKSMLLRPLWKTQHNTLQKLKNWSIFENDLENFIVQNRNYPITAIGHSIGGNIILKVALKYPDYFNQIILLDPTVFDRTTIYLWKLVSLLGVAKKFLKQIDLAENKRMKYKSRINMFENYRGKRVFSKISDHNLMILVDAITEVDEESNVNLIYSNLFEAEIYRSGLKNDNFIWNNLKNLKTNCLIIRGQNTDVFFKKTGIQMASISNKIKVKTLVGSSHLFPLEKPGKTYQLLKSSLR